MDAKGYAASKQQHTAAVRRYQVAIQRGTTAEMVAALDEVDAAHMELCAAAREHLEQLPRAVRAYAEASL